MTHTYCTPLLAFNYEGGSIELGRRLAIDELRDAEYDLGERNHVQVPLAEHCIRLVTNSIGEPPEWRWPRDKPDDPDQPELFAAWKTVRAVATGLRLFKPGQFDATYIVEYRDDCENSGVAGEGQPLDMPRGYTLEAEEGEAFRVFFHQIHHGFDAPWLEYALKRFDMASARQRYEDALVDLSICAESLFLGDDRSGLGDKLALRCAYYLGVTVEERRHIVDEIRRAYALRSAIVHGRHTSANKALGKMARRLGLEEGPHQHTRLLVRVTSDFEARMRQALQRAMRESRQQASSPDWMEMVLGG